MRGEREKAKLQRDELELMLVEMGFHTTARELDSLMKRCGAEQGSITAEAFIRTWRSQEARRSVLLWVQIVVSLTGLHFNDLLCLR